MRKMIVALAMLAAGGVLGAASAQNLTLSGPAWAQTLLAADITPTNGGRANLADAGETWAVRVTIAPLDGGVARVIRFEQRGETNVLALRRFTGHPATGWWLWGPETPYVTHPTSAQRDEIATLLSSAMGATSIVGDATATQRTSCTSREQAFVEMTRGERSVSATRVCVDPLEPIGHLANRLSDLAGSRDDEELHTAAVVELMAADAAFNTMAQAHGVWAAFAEYASENAIAFNGATPVQGHDAVAALYHDWPPGAYLSWAPQAARVSERGDMGWTWGRSVYVAADGTRREGRYVTTWIRDYEGHWRFSFDAALRDPPPGAAAVTTAPVPHAAAPPAHTASPPAHTTTTTPPAHAGPLPPHASTTTSH